MRKMLPFVLVVVCVLFSVQIALAAPAEISESGVFELPSFAAVEGSSQLVRNANGLSYNLETSGLEPGHAYTVWWIIFKNNGDFDFVTNAGGGLAGEDGTANFAGHFSVGEVPQVDEYPYTTIFSVGEEFDDPFGANVILVVRTHGPKKPGMQHVQTRTFFGGCDAPDQALCNDIQISFHFP